MAGSCTKCPKCGYLLKRQGGVFHKRHRAIIWLRKNRTLWQGKDIRGGWKDDRPINDAYKAIANGLKCSGIYSKMTGSGDMPIKALVEEAKHG